MAHTKAWLESSFSYSELTLGEGIELLPGAQNELERMKDSTSPLQLILRQADLDPDAYCLKNNGEEVHLEASDPAGFLYGLFALQGGRTCGESRPSKSLRMINHWDNMDGSIERGYAGRSLFFDDGEFLCDAASRERQKHYARLLASVGINAISFNNVNVDERASRLLLEEDAEALAALCRIFLDYGITPYLSLNFASPITIGGLDTCDPLDPKVISWWEKAFAEFFAREHGVQGFVVKADSEGRPGPFTYGRNQADGANMLARALSPYEGRLIWRAFVYNSQQDWRDRSIDRARASTDYFRELDGAFDENVFLQIKHGPIDFQVREPITPLFYTLRATNIILELQVTQEYTGHQIDLCYLGPMWEDILAQDLPEDMGIAAVSNVGLDENYFGHALAGANLYAYGAYAWNPKSKSKEILQSWFRRTYGSVEASSFLEKMQGSWATYEKYTAPLGVGFMVREHYHYAPSVEAYEYSRWGTYHRANRDGIGIDRTVATGTGYTGLYPEPLASMFENVETCPENLLLFFHHVPYTHVLQNGKTLLQWIYDSRFEGYEEVLAMAEAWHDLKGKVPEQDFLNVQERFERQLYNAREWRDQVNTYFYRFTGIPDAQGRRIYP